MNRSTLSAGKIEEFERRRVEAKKAMICEIYTGIMAEHGTVMEYLPLDRIYDSRWENSTTTQKSYHRSHHSTCGARRERSGHYPGDGIGV